MEFLLREPKPYIVLRVAISLMHFLTERLTVFTDSDNSINVD